MNIDNKDIIKYDFYVLGIRKVMYINSKLFNTLMRMGDYDFIKYKYGIYQTYIDKFDEEKRKYVAKLIDKFNKLELKYLKHITVFVKCPSFIRKIYKKYLIKHYLEIYDFYFEVRDNMTESDTEKADIDTLFCATWQRRVNAVYTDN